ncbi:MAG: methylmalonyl Co-A mutase-associated GTPase MeaB [Acidimicrobiales bacterium]
MAAEDEPAGTRLAEAVRSGDRRALARAITLVESTRDDHRADAGQLVDELLPHTGAAVRIGISGAPGSGKSTLIEALGLHAADRDHRVAVLAVDPSSRRTGGSILGDKTRMADLGRHPNAFIRPSPSSGTLGGVARRTREAMLLCEAAGFDVVLVETVGVGQSEVAVADLVDLFLLVASPAGGDELQGLKRGIMELADLIVVNKADGELAAAAERAAADLRHAVHLLRPKRPGWEVGVATCSALSGAGLPELWEAIETAHERLRADGLAALRASQSTAWMWSEVTETLLDRLRSDPAVRELVPELERSVAAGEVAATLAAQQLLRAFLRS